ncbi:putative lipoprotein [Hyalangium minutum]|uniref:Putative lipoprotein n=2 Tax=Hyalangium minutum TaxID=394096 RepID=A0A085VWK6_9BACT|nr:putative lipoprotein [Hyalangium minutum]
MRSSLTARQALTSAPEALEFEPASTRQELFRELARLSEQEEGQAAQALVLFPISHHGELVAAPGFDARMDLLQAPDAGGVLQLTFDGRTGEHWPEERRDSLQGLSERESSELVARTLLTHWGIQQTGPVQVDRVSGAPYAVAYVDGILRINPAFLYLAAASGLASTSANVQ